MLHYIKILGFICLPNAPFIFHIKTVNMFSVLNIFLTDMISFVSFQVIEIFWIQGLIIQRQ